MRYPPEVEALSGLDRLTVRHSSFYDDHWQRSRHHIPPGSRFWQVTTGCGYEPMYLVHLSDAAVPPPRQWQCCPATLHAQQALPPQKAKRSASSFLPPVHQGCADLSRSRDALIPTLIRRGLVPTRESGSGRRNRPQWGSALVLVDRLRS